MPLVIEWPAPLDKQYIFIPGPTVKAFAGENGQFPDGIELDVGIRISRTLISAHFVSLKESMVRNWMTILSPTGPALASS